MESETISTKSETRHNESETKVKESETKHSESETKEMESESKDTGDHPHDNGGSTDAYFSSYADLSVHELMLKDRPRTEAYRQYIEGNAEYIRGKVVLDVGAGTGILSLFAARAGAKKVYAVEASGLAGLCREIVAANGYSDVIEVIQSRIEDATLPVKQVDVLVSEWMGFYLLHEGMLGSVLWARDQWLAHDGLMLPSAASLYLCPVSLKDYVKETLSVWNSAYGFDFSPLRAQVEARHRAQPQILTLAHAQLLAQPQQVLTLQLRYAQPGDVARIARQCHFTVSKNGVCHGLACWFSCTFCHDLKDAALRLYFLELYTSFVYCIFTVYGIFC